MGTARPCPSLSQLEQAYTQGGGSAQAHISQLQEASFPVSPRTTSPPLLSVTLGWAQWALSLDMLCMLIKQTIGGSPACIPWVGASVPVCQTTHPKLHLPAKKQAVKNPLQLMCVHSTLVFKRRRQNWQQAALLVWLGGIHAESEPEANSRSGSGSTSPDQIPRSKWP